MAELGSGSGTSYPGALDTDSTTEDTTKYARADVPNDLAAAIVAIETALGAPPAINVKIGSFTCPAATGNYSVTGVGFKPRYVEFFINRSTVGFVDFGHGWMDYNGNQNIQSFTIASGVYRNNFLTDRCLYIVSDSGGILVNASFVSMNSDGFTINFTVTDINLGVAWKAVR